ncbi:hypothetical protein JST97_12275 [bacterium]|nr:hypothetical protein [bacterium]
MIPAKPQPIVAPPGAKSVAVKFTGPVLRDESIGHIPADGYSPMIVDLGLGGDQEVIRPQPQMKDGQPVMAEQTKVLDLKPYSPVTRALTRGAIGAAIGGIVGAVVGYFAGNLATFAATGAGLGAAAGGAWGAHSVQGDSVSTDWELTPVTRHRLDGYSHTPVAQTVTTTDSKGNSTTTTTGYWHYYSPNVELDRVGDHQFWDPVVHHSSDRKK